LGGGIFERNGFQLGNIISQGVGGIVFDGSFMTENWGSESIGTHDVVIGGKGT
jgi:hypothetical protein